MFASTSAVQHTIGAWEFVAKPSDPALLKRLLTRSLEAPAGEEADLVGESPALAKLKNQIAQFAASPYPVLIEGETGNMIHSTVPPGQVNRATVHATVSEFWHVLSGEGQIWRRDGTGEETTVLRRGVSIDIPVGTAFQYRCTGVDPLQFLCITMPRWPGDKEATVIEGPWKPTAPAG